MSTHSKYLSRYVQLATISREQNSAIAETLSKDVLRSGARKLGMWHKAGFALNSHDELAVLFDYSIYNVFLHGKSALQRAVATSSASPESDEAYLLRAKAKAWYTIVAAESVEAGVGMQVRDLFRESSYFVMDVGLGSTASPGSLLATRVLPLPDYATTGGAGLPLDHQILDDVLESLKPLAFQYNLTSFKKLTPSQEAEIARLIIRGCRAQENEREIMYVTPEDLFA